LELPCGKKRTINPRVLRGENDEDAPQLSDICEEFTDYCNERNAWIGDYRADFEVEDPEVVKELDKGLKLIESEWPRVLGTRPHMPPSELQRGIKEANDYVLKHGIIQRSS